MMAYFFKRWSTLLQLVIFQLSSKLSVKTIRNMKELIYSFRSYMEKINYSFLVKRQENWISYWALLKSLLLVFQKCEGNAQEIAGSAWRERGEKLDGISSIADKTEGMLYWLNEVKSFNWISLMLCNVGTQGGGWNKVGNVGTYAEKDWFCGWI